MGSIISIMVFYNDYKKSGEKNTIREKTKMKESVQKKRVKKKDQILV